jgi:hypothetical protein
VCTDVEFDACRIYVAGSRTPLSPSKLVIDISKYQGEGGWPTVHNCSRFEHFPIYFGVYSSKKKKLNNLKVFFPFSLRDAAAKTRLAASLCDIKNRATFSSVIVTGNPFLI